MLHVLIASEAKRIRVRLALALVVSVLLTGCGGRGMVSAGNATSASAPNSPAPVAPAPTPTSPSGSPSPTPVNLAAGQAQTGVDIAVAPPSSSPSLNAQDLGVNSTSGLGMASNTGGSIHRGSTMRVLLFGSGLSSNMKITIAGPQDISISNVQGIHATDNTPGLAFTATASASASLGARTVFLQSTNGDVTSFAGGLEVIP